MEYEVRYCGEKVDTVEAENARSSIAIVMAETNWIITKENNKGSNLERFRYFLKYRKTSEEHDQWTGRESSLNLVLRRACFSAKPIEQCIEVQNV